MLTAVQQLHVKCVVSLFGSDPTSPVLQFKAEEVQRCVKGVKGKSFEVEVCVATTATYGDKFRVVCRHRQAVISSLSM